MGETIKIKTLKQILIDNEWSGENCDSHTDKDYCHSYIDEFYEKEFIQYKNKNIKILEIGIASGNSLLLWNEYFGNDTKIYGVDIKSNNVKEEIKKYKNIKTIFTDGYEKNFADSLPNFDIIIDDGPHTLQTMVSFIKLYLPKLNSNGVMVIEDVQSFDWMSVLFGVFEETKKENDEYEIVDLRKIKGRYDDLMFIVRRK